MGLSPGLGDRKKEDAMKVKLSVAERALIPNLLPKEENIFTLRIIQKFKKAIGFEASELELIQFTDLGNGTAQWDATKDPMKEVEMGELVEELLVAELKRLEGAKKLTEGHLSLFEKLVEKQA